MSASSSEQVRSSEARVAERTPGCAGTHSVASIGRLELEPAPTNVSCAQPGGGLVLRLELAWGRVRRRWLRTFRPGYVRRMRELRRGQCPNCTHDVIDARDLKFFGNVCGYRFERQHDRFAWRDRLPLARWGLAELLLFSTILIAAGIVAAALGAWYLLPLPAVLLAFVLWFFRDPARRIPEGRGVIVAPADGKVVEIERLAHDAFVGGPAVRIGIFLSIFNVHTNRSPERVRVVGLEYRRGKFLNALRAESARENEQMWLRLEAEEPPHRRYVVRQIAGAIARRIVSAARTGQVLERGERFGMIKLGSRTELVLPDEEGLVIEAACGMKVRAGQSVLAKYRELES